LDEYTYTIQSVNEFTESAISGSPDPNLLVAYTTWTPVQPEQIRVIEFGYKGLINNQLMIDLNYYHNTYNDFITQKRIRQAQIIDSNGNRVPTDPFTDINALLGLTSGGVENTFQIYTNNKQTVKSQGASAGLDYSITRGYNVGFSWAWNMLIEEGLPADFFNDYNTPEHVLNFRFGNRRVTDNFGFNIAYRYQTEFIWNSSFAQNGVVPAYGFLDAQVSYKISSIRSILKVGGSNVLNNRYFSAYGNPTLGAIYYISLTFDELLN